MNDTPEQMYALLDTGTLDLLHLEIGSFTWRVRVDLARLVAESQRPGTLLPAAARRAARLLRRRTGGRIEPSLEIGSGDAIDRRRIDMNAVIRRRGRFDMTDVFTRAEVDLARHCGFALDGEWLPAPGLGTYTAAIRAMAGRCETCVNRSCDCQFTSYACRHHGCSGIRVKGTPTCDFAKVLALPDRQLVLHARHH
ncbi:hypothetical protein [Actinoplanes derwentensis]|uniref:Uncharacterized protein n=1 Tax=Actinoplanes derwentensis TaxID=113562 RepID=A0A1H2CUL4_9ACTN|nr:hypothetical protein [Actinoplanes derwentensis]GID81970.1 hypothetical protein Ade03nite_08940 [Actinoplanes derwentensis]SDT74240.1 hypothetical protein SAMN04489716_6919 [Actinoplanes derwentensis]